MKKGIVIFSLLTLLGCAATEGILLGKKEYKNRNKDLFFVKDCTVYYNEKPIAKYQAKTFSLDGGELVEEYNLLLLDNQLENKQIIGDLIDFISDRHLGAEVEIEVDSNGSIFKL